MASKPMRPCRHPGCTVLVPHGYCPAHTRAKPVRESRSAESRSYHSWYSRKVWRERLRPEQLTRQPFCVVCSRFGVRTRATDVDHIEPHDGDWKKFIDPENLQSLCRFHHSAKTAGESRAKARKAGR